MIRILNLAGDFRFADHQGVNAAGNRKQMFRRRRAFLDVEMRGKIKIAAGKFLKELLDTTVDPGRNAVNLHAIAGGKQHHFFQPATQLEPAAAALQARALDGQLLTHLHGRGLVAQSGNKDFHNLI